MAEFYNLEAEKVVLNGLLRKPSLRADIQAIKSSDYSPDVNRKVLDALDACIASGEPWSEYLVIDRLNSLGIKLGGVLEPGAYISSLLLMSVTDAAVIGMAKTIKKWTIRRELYNIGKDIVALTAEDKADKKSADLLSDVTEAFNRRVNILGGNSEDEPQDLYASIRGLMEKENVYDTNSVGSPWPLYNDFYGSYDAGQVYCICARAKTGKSTWVMSMLDQIMRQDEDFCALLMDTELTLEEVGFRLVSSLTGIKEYHIRHKYHLRKGKEEMRKKIEAAYELIDPFMGRIDHRFVGGMSLEQQTSIMKRWTFKNKIKKKHKCLIVYDYLKLDGDEFDSKQSRDITLGKKANVLKNLAKELQIPIWTLVQASRANEDGKDGSRISNGSVVAGSDMISQFFSNIYLLQRLAAEERRNLNQINPTDATHALLPVYTRQLGPEEMGKCGMVRYQEINPVTKKSYDKWCENYILYSFCNFRVSEIGTFRDVWERSRSLGIPIAPPADSPPGDLL